MCVLCACENCVARVVDNSPLDGSGGIGILPPPVARVAVSPRVPGFAWLAGRRARARTRGYAATVGCYSCARGLLSCYSRANYRFVNNLPYTPVAPMCLVGDEPAVFDQSFGRVECALPISDGFGAVDTDLACADGGFVPPLEPIEQSLCGIFAWLADWLWLWCRSTSIQSLK